MKTLTLTFLLTPQEICLAYKKRGFGAGKWNGYGGKCEPGETITEAACRELWEESRVLIMPEALEPVAQHEFNYPGADTMLVHAFLIRHWDGRPVETEEMRPAWFSYEDIPYPSMWADDEHWLPRILAGERLTGRVHFAADHETIKTMQWQVVAEF